MKYFLSAGEASGDLHGALLIKAIKARDVNARFCILGGDKMQEACGEKALLHVRDLAVMGFWEVLKKLGRIRKQLRTAQEALTAFQPDKVILIDFPGFNLRMARYAHDRGFQTHYYISPKVWAWNTKRALKIKACVDHLYSILPFEEAFYRQFDYPVHYIGNPLVDAIAEHVWDVAWMDAQKRIKTPLIALLPGSRKQELSRILPVMLETMHLFPDFRVMIAAAPGFTESDYAPYLRMFPDAQLVYGKTYELLRVAQAACVTSGTATLETALIGTPQVVLYRSSALSVFIARLVIKVKYISLVNLILNRPALKELIQNECTPEHISDELHKVLAVKPHREKMLQDYAELRALLGEAGAPERAARVMTADI